MCFVVLKQVSGLLFNLPYRHVNVFSCVDFKHNSFLIFRSSTELLYCLFSFYLIFSSFSRAGSQCTVLGRASINFSTPGELTVVLRICIAVLFVYFFVHTVCH